MSVGVDGKVVLYSVLWSPLARTSLMWGIYSSTKAPM